MDAVTAGLAIGWFVLCAAYNVVIKKVFDRLPIPILATVLQSLASLAVAWVTARTKIRLSKSDIAIKSASRTAVMLFAHSPRNLILLSLLHFGGFWMTSISVSTGSVAFAHIIKACEPVSTVLVSRIMFRAVYPWSMYGAICIIVLGAGLCSYKPGATLVAVGCAPAVASNLAMSSYFLLSKQLMSDKKLDVADEMRSAIQFHDMRSSVLLVGVSALSALWGVVILCAQFTASVIGDGPSELLSCRNLSASTFGLLSLSALLHGSYNAASFTLLSRVVPMTHAVLGCIRRLVVIGTGLLLGNSLSGMQWIGAVTAATGIGLYNRVKVGNVKDEPTKLKPALSSLHQPVPPSINTSGDFSESPRSSPHTKLSPTIGPIKEKV